MSEGIEWGGVLLMAGLYAVFLVVGWWAARRTGEATADASGFLVAGRAMPLWVATMTMTATWIDGGYLLGTAEYTYQYGAAQGLQGGLCFGLSLVLGGLFFARRMRKAGHTTMVDAFEQRYGRTWGAVLALPALLGEVFWSGALLVSLGATLSVLINLDMRTATLAAAAVVTAYTLIGGMWSVAYTDVVQLLLIPVGTLVAVAFAAESVGGLGAAIAQFSTGRPEALVPLPVLSSPGGAASSWSWPAAVSWWDMTIMLVFGGIPWNCYFQRVLSCSTPDHARSHSLWAGLVTMLMTIPPCLLGIIAYAGLGPEGIKPASLALPMLLKTLTPYPVMLLGLAAIIGAVTSSLSSSLLSAGAMLSWNIGHRLLWPSLSDAALRRLVQASILFLGVIAAWLAIRVQSVAALWLFTGDLVFVLLFPQLAAALFDAKANRTGSMAGFAVALAVRLSGGISLATDRGLVGFEATVPYHLLTQSWFEAGAGTWTDEVGASLWLVRTLAAVLGALTIWGVSRWSHKTVVIGLEPVPAKDGAGS